MVATLPAGPIERQLTAPGETSDSLTVHNSSLLSAFCCVRDGVDRRLRAKVSALGVASEFLALRLRVNSTPTVSVILISYVAMATTNDWTVTKRTAL